MLLNFHTEKNKQICILQILVCFSFKLTLNLNSGKIKAIKNWCITGTADLKFIWYNELWDKELVPHNFSSFPCSVSLPNWVGRSEATLGSRCWSGSGWVSRIQGQAKTGSRKINRRVESRIKLSWGHQKNGQRARLPTSQFRKLRDQSASSLGARQDYQQSRHGSSKALLPGHFLLWLRSS